jgi:hypothetical protein
MFIPREGARDALTTYEAAPTNDALIQRAEYERMGPNGGQVAYAVGLVIAGAVGALGVVYLLYTCFRWRRARLATAKNLRPLKLLSPVASTTSSTLTVGQEPEKQVIDPGKAGNQVRVF